MVDSELGRTRRQSGKLQHLQIEQAWEHMALTGTVNDQGLRKLVSDSWSRCLAQGVLPTSDLLPRAADASGLARLRESNSELLLASQNSWQLLGDILADTESMMLVADAQGVILDACGSPAIMERGKELGVTVGYEWSETIAGTNAVGTAIATGSPAEVESVEHFRAIAKLWACAAAPVHDFFDGSLLGVIDVTTFGDARHGHSLALAATTAHQIEQTLRSRELARNVQLLHWYQANAARWTAHPHVLLDRKGRVVSSNARAQALLREQGIELGLVRGASLLQIRAGEHVDAAATRLAHGLRAQAFEAYGRGADWSGGLLVLEASSASAAALSAPARRAIVVDHFAAIIGQSTFMTELKRRAARVARGTAPVLILGETGTGKELFAHAIHRSSPRAKGPLIAVNCGLLTRELAASELFGYDGGAFTGALSKGQAGKFEQADGGTLFLDEVGELPLEVQVGLLRVLADNVVVRVGGSQSRQLDLRIIAATNQDLDAAVNAGRFRRDLYYRLKVLELELPPLRNRTEDVAVLARHCLLELEARYALGIHYLSDELLRRLETAVWPGNVRELRAVLESLYLMGESPILSSADLPPAFGRVATAVSAMMVAEPITVAGVERDAILTRLKREGGNRARAARALGISRSTLYRRLRSYDA